MFGNLIMKCKSCRADVLGTFTFCPSCGGNILDNTAPTSSPSPSPGVNKPSLKAAESAKSVPSFEEFKRRKSEDRISKGKKEGTKKQKKAPSDVLINIGIMNMVKGVLKPVRGKVLMIKIPFEARKLDIVKISLKICNGSQLQSGLELKGTLDVVYL